MSFKKFMPYELNNSNNAKKNRIDSRLDGPSGSSGIPKRDVYPQFSEPDDYGFSRTPQNTSLQQGRFNIPQTSSSFMAKPWPNPQPHSDAPHESLGNSMPLHQPMSTFRQYLKGKNETDQIVQKNNYEMNCNQTSSFSGTGKSSVQVMSQTLEEKHEPIVHQSRNPKSLIGTRIRHMIGSVDQVIRWHKMAKQSELELHYEVAGILESTINKECMQLLLIRSESGHILQGVFYAIDRELSSLPTRTLITATGNMIGSNKIHIFDMNEISRDDFLAVQRLAFLSQRALEEAL